MSPAVLYNPDCPGCPLVGVADTREIRAQWPNKTSGFSHSPGQCRGRQQLDGCAKKLGE